MLDDVFDWVVSCAGVEYRGRRAENGCVKVGDRGGKEGGKAMLDFHSKWGTIIPEQQCN